MSVNLPGMLDAWRMVAARRSFEGRVPLSALKRLDGLLMDAEGEVEFALQFDRDALQVPYVELTVRGELPLECQRGLHRFLFPVSVRQRLGLIRDDAEEAALPPDYEALLVPEDGMLRPLDLVEDELVLAVPAVPLDPDMPPVDQEWAPQDEETAQANPFAALASLKNKN